MDYSSLPSSSTHESWLYSPMKEPVDDNVLQEPVPFEDFKFSFGMDPDFSFPLEPTLPTPQLSFMQDPFLLFPNANTVLDENDQKAFSTFLDTFFIDSDLPSDGQLQSDYYQYNTDAFWEEEEEEKRRNSILQSLDERKKLHQRLNLIAALPKKSKSASPTPVSDLMTPSPSFHTHSVTSTEEEQLPSVYLTSDSNFKQNPNKRQLNEGKKKESEHVSKKIRSNKELLTEEEKRANHIASEQKRRSTIRTGFKELTELVPTLKNLNNSKSTVLFKSVEYIRYLDKRNSRLKEKVGSLELRVEVEGRMIQQSQPKTSHYPEEKVEKKVQIKPSAEHKSVQKRPAKQNVQMVTPLSIAMLDGHIKRKRSDSVHSVTSSNESCDSKQNDAHLQGLPTNTRNALKAHKSQQKQLLLLQEQLQLHQRLIAQQQERRDKALQTHINKLPPILGQYDSNKTSLLTEMDDKAISAP